MTDKFEAVQKVTETLSKQTSAEERDRLSPNKEHFDTLMSSSKTIDTAAFERIDNKALGTEEVTTDEKSPIVDDENGIAQQSGSATDKDQKRRHQNQSEEIAQVDSISSKKRSQSPTLSSSLMDEVSKLNSNVKGMAAGSAEAIKAQAKEAISQIEQMKTKLSQAKGDIKPSYQTVLRNRLEHIDDNLKIALNKAGVEYTPIASHKVDNKNAIHRFISYLADSEKHINSLNAAIEDLGTRKELTPGKMLAIQMKMTTVAQQMELFSNLLNKALESTKTIMNVQV